jgi:hypothetical protein
MSRCTLAVALLATPTVVRGQSSTDLIPTQLAFCGDSADCNEPLSPSGKTSARVTVLNLGAPVHANVGRLTLCVGAACTTRVLGVPFLSGEQHTISVPISLPAAPGRYDVTATVDRVADQVQEAEAPSIPLRQIVEVGEYRRAGVGITPMTPASPAIDVPDIGDARADVVVDSPELLPSVPQPPASEPPPATPPLPQEAAAVLPQQEAVVASQEEQEEVVTRDARDLLVEPQRGRVSGAITAADTGEPLAGAGVAIYDAVGTLVDWRTTDSSGAYLSGDLPPGDYQVVAHRNFGWQDTIYRDAAVTNYASVTLRAGESYRFSTGEVLPASAGDFYLGFFNDRAQFWSNAAGQRGLIALGDIRRTPLEIIVPPDPACAMPNAWAAAGCYATGGVDAVPGHTYVALARAGDPSAFIVFRITDVQPGLWVRLSYVVTAGESRAEKVVVHAGAVTPAIDQRVARVPAIFSIAPDHGDAEGGTQVVISGANFAPGASVLFGGVAAQVDVLSPSTIVAIAPPHAAGAFDVEVWNADAVAASPELTYRFDVAPPAAFTKMPAGSDITSRGVTLAWTESRDAVAYQVCFDSTDDGRCSIDVNSSFGWMDVGTAKSVTWPRTAFAPGTAFYWQVRAINTNGVSVADEGEWSQFSVASVDIAELTSPAPHTTLPGSTISFAWTSGNGVSAYSLEVGSSPGASDIFAATVTGGSQSVTLPEDGRALFVRLGSLLDGDWLYKEYQFHAPSRFPRLGLGSGGSQRKPHR